MNEKCCGRLDGHDPHQWPGFEWPPDHDPFAGPSSPKRTAFHCGGAPVIEGSGYWAEWDAEDDAREARMDREGREAS